MTYGVFGGKLVYAIDVYTKSEVGIAPETTGVHVHIAPER